METVGDAPAGLVEHGTLPLHRPVAAQAPFVESQRGGHDVATHLVSKGPSGRRRPAAVLVADIGLRRADVGGVGCGLRPGRVHLDRRTSSNGAARLAQQLAYHRLRLVVVALAVVVVADATLCIGDIQRGPVVVAERPPDQKVIVDRDRERKLQLADRAAHIDRVLLERELGRVNADHHETLLLVALGPRANVGDRTQAVDARVGPEVDDDHSSTQALGGQWRRVDPLGRACQRRQKSPDRQGKVRTHRHRPCRWRDRGDPVDQRLLDPGRAGRRQPCQPSRVETQCDDDDAAQHGHADAAPNPFTRPERALHRVECAPADDEC